MGRPTVHIIPVGFDYDRLIAPLIRDKLDVDRVILLQGSVGSEENVEYSKKVAAKLEEDFESLLDAETERVTLENVYDYQEIFARAYGLILDEFTSGREVYVNVSAMPRTVSFGFTTAAHAVIVEEDEAREHIHTYYTAPEKYLETDLAEELQEMVHLLRRLKNEGLTDSVESDLDERFAEANDLLDEFDERGTTVGAKSFDGSHIIEIPVAPLSKIKPFERVILFKLHEEGVVKSVSELADHLADDLDEEYTDSFRSKVIYNTRSLREKGYILQEESGKSHETRLSRLGELWVESHRHDTET
ncbi:DUF6293 family protein [Halorutilales archaeon Cl-col2-1]